MRGLKFKKIKMGSKKKNKVVKNLKNYEKIDGFYVFPIQKYVGLKLMLAPPPLLRYATELFH